MFKKHFWLILILVATGFFIYAFNLNNGLFWDDDDWILNNTYAHNVTWDNVKFWFTHNTLAGVGLKSNYYRPFLFFTFAVNWVMAGVKPLAWHLTSNLIHIANGVLIYLLLSRIFSRQTPPPQIYADRKSIDSNFSFVPFFAALLFLIHPLQTEAVTYISGRGDLLVVFFMLLALSLILFRSSTPKMFGGSTSKHQKVGPLTKSSIYWPLSVGLLVLALLSRETAIIFPFLATLVLMILSQDRFLISLKKSLKATAPFFGVVGVYGILRLTALNFQNTLNFYPEANVYSESLMVRLYTFGGVLIDYVQLLFVPLGLHMERSVTVYTSLSQWPIWAVFLALVGLVAFLVYLYRKERFLLINQKSNIKNQNDISKFKNEFNLQPRTYNLTPFRVWFFGVAWFFIGLAPVSGITPINAVMYEHWLYLPMISLWFIAAFYLARLFYYLKENRKPLFVICVLLFGAYISFFVVQGIKRNVIWGKPIEFYQDILRYEPQSTRVNNNLGNLYFNQKDLTRAKQYYEKAAEGDDNFAQPHFNLGSVLESEGDIFGAIQRYEKAIEIDPNFYYAHQNLMALYARTGDLDKAIEYVEILKKLKPQDPRVFYNAALIYVARNDRAAAAASLKAGLLVASSDPYAKGLIEELLAKLDQ